MNCATYSPSASEPFLSPPGTCTATIAAVALEYEYRYEVMELPGLCSSSSGKPIWQALVWEGWEPVRETVFPLASGQIGAMLVLRRIKQTPVTKRKADCRE